MKSIQGALFATLMIFCFAAQAGAADSVEVTPVGTVCSGEECAGRHAVFFIHGIYGNKKTFSEKMDWPKKLKEMGINNQQVDVYLINYQTMMINWLTSDMATLDVIVDDLYRAMYGNDFEVRGLLDNKRYKSYGFIAHSLGGNVSAAFVHSIKSRRGHIERARVAYVVTLGTPALGADISRMGQLAKSLLLMQQDPLLESLKRDNTFLRMMLSWRVGEEGKANVMGCRPVELFAGYETERTNGFQVVASKATADELKRQGLTMEDTKSFPGYDHVELVKPEPGKLEVFDWVNQKVSRALTDADKWKGPLCTGTCYTVTKSTGQGCRKVPNEWPRVLPNVGD